MRKSKDITKYDVDWQIVRSKVKGPKTDLISKLGEVRKYWDITKTKDSWERIVNWLEGLRMGYIAAKNQQALNDIDNEILWYKQQAPTKKEQVLTDNLHKNKISKYAFNERIALWKDLFTRNKKWLAKGYFHPEHNHFMDLLYDVFVTKKEDANIPTNYSFNNLQALRQAAVGKENTHKFFF